MIAPKSVVLSSEPHSSVVVAFVKYVAKNGPIGASLVYVTITPPNVPKISA